MITLYYTYIKYLKIITNQSLITEFFNKFVLMKMSGKICTYCNFLIFWIIYFCGYASN